MSARRVAVALATVIAAALACASCSAILGIEQLPGRSDASATGDARDDAPINCETERHTCACEKHDFCDDFDTAGEPLFLRWRGTDEAANPFIIGNASVTLADAHFSPPNAVHIVASETNRPAYALAFHRPLLPAGRAFAGVRLGTSVRVDALSFTEVRGPLPDVGTALVQAIARGVPPFVPGVAIVVGERGIFLVASENLFQSKITDASPPSGVIVNLLGDETPALPLLRNWIHVEIVIATVEVAIREGYRSCEGKASAGSPVIAASVGPAGGLAQCTPLPATFDGGVDWAREPTVTVGGALYGGGELSVFHDDATLDFLEP